MKESELKENGNKNNINPNKARSSTTNSNALNPNKAESNSLSTKYSDKNSKFPGFKKYK